GNLPAHDRQLVERFSTASAVRVLMKGESSRRLDRRRPRMPATPSCSPGFTPAARPALGAGHAMASRPPHGGGMVKPRARRLPACPLRPWQRDADIGRPVRTSPDESRMRRPTQRPDLTPTPESRGYPPMTLRRWLRGAMLLSALVLPLLTVGCSDNPR